MSLECFAEIAVTLQSQQQIESLTADFEHAGQHGPFHAVETIAVLSGCSHIRLELIDKRIELLGKRLWTWCFCASLFTVFKISPSRGSQVLIEVLGGEFDGVLGCDYFIGATNTRRRRAFKTLSCESETAFSMMP